ncbi:MAG: diacylglycerol kinase family lipid kinase [Vicinamibacteria bacterium]|nr:diacylglycerol kinase family lipid kinase [Vicinamibacteria bacterium]
MAASYYVVFNPRSGKGRGATLIEPVTSWLRAQGFEVDHGLTEAPGDERRLAREAASRGFGTIVAVGGDGTWGNAANGVLEAGKPTRLGFIAGGTGCDFVKTLGIPGKDLRQCLHILAAGRTRRVDVGVVEGKRFLNVLGFGFDVAVLEDSWTVTRLQGDLLYLYCALRQLRNFPGFRVWITADDQPEQAHDLLMLIVANARVFGGAFKIAPGADLGDGRLDSVAFANMGLGRRLSLMGKLLRGTHEQAPDVKMGQPARLRLRFETAPTYETDGEWNRAHADTLDVHVEPAALEVLVP